MKAALGFALAFLFFSTGIQGRAGSMLAAFIDPSALTDLTSSTGDGTSSVSGGTGVFPAVPDGPLTKGTDAGPSIMKPDPTIKTNGGCKKGYLPINGMCYRAVQVAF